MNESEALRGRLTEESVPCTDDEFAVLLAGLPAAREAVARLWAVDCGDLPPCSGLVET